MPPGGFAPVYREQSLDSPALKQEREAVQRILFHTTTVFGAPLEITLSELAIEAFYPANPETAAIMQSMGSATPTESR